jgi:hypothetical protein
LISFLSGRKNSIHATALTRQLVSVERVLRVQREQPSNDRREHGQVLHFETKIGWHARHGHVYATVRRGNIRLQVRFRHDNPVDVDTDFSTDADGDIYYVLLISYIINIVQIRIYRNRFLRKKQIRFWHNKIMCTDT